MLQKTTLTFLRDLKKNNNKAWFDTHRSVYEAAKADFASFIQKVIDAHGRKDVEIKNMTAKECIYRINRDIRFSKDKTPYKHHFGASINKGGKQTLSSAGYYFHLEPGNMSITGGGIWMPPAPELKKIRQEIDYNLGDFRKTLSTKKFKSIYGDLSRSKEYVLTRVPKGYEADNPAAEYLRLKSYLATAEIRDEDLISPLLIKKTLSSFEALQPVIRFINTSIEG